MYSTALKHFKRYLEDKNDQEFKVGAFKDKNDPEFRAELFKDELEYEKNITKNIANNNTSIKIIDRGIEKPSHRSVSNHKLWSRNPKVASDAIAYAKYQCEFNNNHQDLISKYTQQNYVEAHHLIPMKYQGEFEYSLDVHANVVSLCMVCHKKLHYGIFDDMKEILDKLFDDRKDRLIKSNIGINLNDLYTYYQ